MEHIQTGFWNLPGTYSEVLEVIKKPVHKAGCLNASFAEVKNAA